MTPSDSSPKGFFYQFKWAYLSFFVVSAIMLWNTRSFKLDSGMERQQFGFGGYDANSFESLTQYFSNNFSSYNYFFYWDMLFMATICWMVFALYHKIDMREEVWGRLAKWIPRFLIGFGALGIIADCVENYAYLNGIYSLSFVAGLKMAFAGLFMLGFLVYAIINAQKKTFKRFFKFLRASYISIIILILIGFGLTLLPQGATLIVDLFHVEDFPGIVSIIFSVFFVNMIAIAVSHYPKYIEFRHSDNKDKVTWHMTEQYKGMGIITYKTSLIDDDAIVFGRYVLGILTYVAWFYIIYKAFALYGITLFTPFSATVICAILYLLVAVSQFKKFMKDKNAFYVRKIAGDLTDEDLAPIRNWVKIYIVWLLYTIVFGIICLVIYCWLGWHVVSYIVSLIFIFCNANCFLLFRFTRGLMMYARGDGDQIARLKKKDFKSEWSVDKAEEDFKFVTIWNYILKGRVWRFFVDFSSSYVFLRRMQIAGYVSLGFLAMTNILLAFGEVTIISSIPIFLAFLVNAYALIILYEKHMIFYNDYENDNYYLHKKNKDSSGIDQKGVQLSKETKNKFVVRLMLAPILFLVVFFGLKGIKNFHRMDFTEAKESFHVKEYGIHLTSHMKTKKINRMAKVASFGGGLKSNLWNLLVLDKLDKEMSRKKPGYTFLDYCFSFSGVSGGAVGLGNYLALDYNVKEHELDKKKAIEAIGNENILSIDMAGLFVHDQVFGALKVFGNGRNKDRSYFAMEQYIKILSDKKEERRNLLSETSQQQAWYQMFKKRGHIPALIINTASTGPYPGVAFSLKSKGEKVFPGYILLEDPSSDLRYFDAASTSNRFPIMSPSAQVENKGFFLDGGYFENSGLLTSSYFQKYLRNKMNVMDTTPVVTINVINSKSDYIRNFINGKLNDDILLKSSTNISAIISGITDINKLPNVLRSAEGEYVEKGDIFRSIYLPHKITTTDIENLLGGKVEFNEAILKEIQQNNADIDAALESYISDNGLDINIKTRGVVEPPLARTLSYYAVVYQQAMISNFKSTQDEVAEIVNWLNN